MERGVEHRERSAQYPVATGRAEQVSSWRMVPIPWSLQWDTDIFPAHPLSTAKQLCSGTATRKSSSARCWHAMSSRASLRTTEHQKIEASKESFQVLRIRVNVHALGLLHSVLGFYSFSIGYGIHTACLAGVLSQAFWWVYSVEIEACMIYVHGRLSLNLLLPVVAAEWIRSLA
jgi:hypothetical protein